MKTALVIALALLTCGCSTIRNPFSEPNVYAALNPPRVHVHQKEVSDLEPMKTYSESTKAAEKIPFEQYYAALLDAKKSDSDANKSGRHLGSSRTPAEKGKMQEFALQGIATVNAVCLRWFHNLMESQIRLNFAASNRNVIKDLGTTLMGLADANRYVVGTYGALSTALSGVENNFSQTFLLAPNASKIKSHVFMALNSRAEDLLQKAGNERATFAQIYDDLERYADICTQHTAREIMNTALDQTKTAVNNDEAGRVLTTPTKAAADIEKKELAAAVEKIDQVKTFSDLAAKQFAEQAKDLRALEKKNADLEKTLSDVRAANAKLMDDLNTVRKTLDSKAEKVSQPDAKAVQPISTAPAQLPAAPGGTK